MTEKVQTYRCDSPVDEGDEPGPFVAAEDYYFLKAEVERLRAALEEVARAPQPVCARGHRGAPDDPPCDCAGDMVRAALAGREGA